MPTYTENIRNGKSEITCNDCGAHVVAEGGHEKLHAAQAQKVSPPVKLVFHREMSEDQTCSVSRDGVEVGRWQARYHSNYRGGSDPSYFFTGNDGVSITGGRFMKNLRSRVQAHFDQPSQEGREELP